MTVQELMRLLEQQDPNVAVFLVTNQGSPEELELAGLALREDADAEEDWDCGNDDCDDDDSRFFYGHGTKADDVLLVAGKWLRNGSATAWKVL